MDEQTKTEIWDLAAGAFIAVSVVSSMAYFIAIATSVTMAGLLNRAGNEVPLLLTTETAMKAPAARSQISVFVCPSIGVSPVGLQPAKPKLPTTQGAPLARARAWSRRHSERSARRLESFPTV